MIVPAALTLELDVVQDATVIEIVLGCRIVRLIEQGEI
jgi:hypothetical protein